MSASRVSNVALARSRMSPLVHTGTGVDESGAVERDVTSHRPESQARVTVSRVQRCVGATVEDQIVISLHTLTCALWGEYA